MRDATGASPYDRDITLRNTHNTTKSRPLTAAHPTRQLHAPRATEVPCTRHQKSTPAQKSDTLRKAMTPYNRDAVTLMLIRFFKRDTDEHGNLVYDNHYFNLRNLPTLHDVELNNNMRASESKLCTYDTELTTDNYVEARERLSEAISRATKNMSSRIKNA